LGDKKREKRRKEEVEKNEVERMKVEHGVDGIFVRSATADQMCGTAGMENLRGFTVSSKFNDILIRPVQRGLVKQKCKVACKSV
jgi:hypothetical protein